MASEADLLKRRMRRVRRWPDGAQGWESPGLPIENGRQPEVACAGLGPGMRICSAWADHIRWRAGPTTEVACQCVCVCRMVCVCVCRADHRGGVPVCVCVSQCVWGRVSGRPLRWRAGVRVCAP